MSFIVAIDGPTSSGKSTVAKLISSKLNFTYIQTGAMYRCIALEMLNNNISIDDDSGIRNILDNMDIKFENSHEKQLIIFNGNEITEEIRSKKVTDFTSSVASISQVRKKLLDTQRSLAQNRNIIMEGRDIGTTVFPNADVKFFLNANPLIRAERRRKELEKYGEKIDFIKVLESIYKWDKEAVEREEGALKRAKDSIYIDTSDLSIEELADQMITTIRYKYNDKFDCLEI